jgi:uncharacterized membrane protein HdeD (DUF308 family)
MTALVVIAGILALISGLVKIFGKGRIPGTVPLFALLEVMAACAAPFVAFTLKPPPVVSGTFVFLLIALVIVSSVSRAMELRVQRRRREHSESARLANHVDHL